MSQRKASNCKKISSCDQASNILAKSKKIQKEPKPERQKPVKTNRKSPEKYKTFKNVKEEILALIRLYLEFNGLLSSEVYAELCDLDQDDYDLMLNTLIPDYDESFTAGNILDLRRWRRKAKDWFKKDGAPDARGAPLVPHELKETFKDNLKNAFLYKEICHKSFANLRIKVLEILHLMGVPHIEDNSCSKRWWYDFLPQNKDIEDLWNDLPKSSSNTSPKREISEEIKNEESASTIAEETQTYQNIFESLPQEMPMPASLILFAESPFHNSNDGFEENGQNLQQSPEDPEFFLNSVFAPLDYGNFQVREEPCDSFCDYFRLHLYI